MLKYLLGQLSQVSSWIGVLLIICSFLAPRWGIAILGVLLFLSHDESLKNWVNKNAPGISNWISKLVSEL